MSQSFQSVSLFSGAGGMDLGVQQAGFKVLACIENDPNCCETLRYALEKERTHAKIFEEDIRKVEPKNILQEIALSPGAIDLLFGGPPCQAFSQIGKQEGLKDDRGMLLFQMARFARNMKPRSVLIEQVPGLLSSKGKNGERGEILELFIKELKSLGFTVKKRVLNAADYGVPQLRKRLFIVAMKDGNFEFPEPTHTSPDATKNLFNLSEHRTVGEVLRGLRRPSLKNGRPREDSHVDVTPEGDKARIKGVPEGCYLSGQTHLPKEQIKKLTKKDTTKYLRVDRKAPSKTLRCGEIFFHHTLDRYLTPREYMRIHGYPDDHLLKGPIRSRSGRVRNLDQHRQVANSVPPPLAKAIADQIRKVLSCRKSMRSSDIH